MSKNLASLPTYRRVHTMSNPQLVASIRNLAKAQVIFKLRHNGSESPTAYLYREALAEAARRHLIINPPELINESEDD